MQSDPSCRRYLDEALRYHVLPSRQPAMQSRRTRVRNTKCIVAFGGRYGFNIGYKYNSNKMHALVGRHATGYVGLEDEMPPLTGPDYSKKQSPEHVESAECDSNDDKSTHSCNSNFLENSPHNVRWCSLPPTKANLLFSSVCVVDNFMYVCGGMGKPAHACATCYRFDPRMGTWTRLASMRSRRQSFPLVAIEQTRMIYAFGGGTPLDCRGLEHSPTDRSECYDIDHDRWTSITVLPDKRKSVSACEIGGVLYISGGRMEQHTVKTMWSYRPATNTYTQLSDMLNPHAGHAMLAHDNGTNLYVIDRIVVSVEKYSLSDDVWTVITQTDSLVQGARLLSGVARPAVCDQCIYFISYIHNESDYRCSFFDIDKLSTTSLPDYPEQVHCVMAATLAFPRHMLVDNNNNP